MNSSSNHPKATINNLSSELDELSLRSLSSEDVSTQSPRGYCCAKSINPADGRGRKLHLLQMLILPFIPIMALIVQTTIILDNVMVYRNEVNDIETQVKLFKQILAGRAQQVLHVRMNHPV